VKAATISIRTLVDYSIWLEDRQHHVGMRNLHKLQKEGHILGLMNDAFEKDRPCGACQAGKQVGPPHHAKNIMTTTRPLEMLHIVTP
jgi:hypothetical protein